MKSLGEPGLILANVEIPAKLRQSKINRLRLTVEDYYHVTQIIRHSLSLGFAGISTFTKIRPDSSQDNLVA